MRNVTKNTILFVKKISNYFGKCVILCGILKFSSEATNELYSVSSISHSEVFMNDGKSNRTCISSIVFVLHVKVTARVRLLQYTDYLLKKFVDLCCAGCAPGQREESSFRKILN